MKVKPGEESEDLRGMRESIGEMEQELKGIEKDIEEAKRIPNPEMREVAVKNLTKMRDSTREMLASFKETYRVMLESEAYLYDLRKENAGRGRPWTPVETPTQGGWRFFKVGVEMR